MGIKELGASQFTSPSRTQNTITRESRLSFSIVDVDASIQPIFVGIAGGTASGKTTVCDEIFKRVRVGEYK